MKCAIYTRVSSNKQVEKGHSLEAQEKLGIDTCIRNNWEYQVFVEKGQSADKETINNRPVLQRIIDSAERGEISYCFVTELDRLSRNTVALAMIKKIFSDNAVKVATVGQIYDFQDEEDDFITDLLGILAKRENRIRVRRSQRGLKESILKGNWFGIQSVPFGYALKDKKLVPDKEESEIYRLMVKWCIEEGIGSTRIARRLNAMNIVTKASKVRFKGQKKYRWKHAAVWTIFRNPIYKGEFTYKGDKVKTPNLISPEDWEQLQEAIRSHCQSSPRNTKYFYLLSGLLKCKKCGKSLQGHIKPNRNERTYMCASKKSDPEPHPCGLKNVKLDKLNNVVWESVKSIIADSGKLKEAIKARENEDFVGETLFDAELRQIDNALREKEEEKKRLLDLYIKGLSFGEKELDEKARSIDEEKSSLTKRREEIVEQMTSRRKRQETLERVKDMSASLRDKMDAFTGEEKKRFLQLVIDKILVDYDDKKQEHTIEIQGAIPVFEDTSFDTHLAPSSDNRPLRQCSLAGYERRRTSHIFPGEF